MKKPFLLVLLVLNIVALAVTGTIVCRYFFFRGNKLNSDTVISEEADSEVSAYEARKQAESARLNITSVPPDVKVFVNGYYKGKTPVEVEIVSVQTNTGFKLVLLKKGFLRWEKNIKLHMGDFREIHAVLEEAEDEIY